MVRPLGAHGSNGVTTGSLARAPSASPPRPPSVPPSPIAPPPPPTSDGQHPLFKTVDNATLAKASHDARALRILAKTIYRELRQGGLVEEDVMAIAGEMLGLVAGEVKDRRRLAEEESKR